MKSSTPSPFDARRITDKIVVETIRNTAMTLVNREDMLQALKLLRKDNKSVVPQIKRLLRTGSPTAQKMVANIVSRTFSHITDAYRHSEDDPSWIYRCENAWSPYLGHEMDRSWHLGNLMEEFDDLDNMDEVLIRSSVDNLAHGMNSLGIPCSVTPGSDAYWRGLTGLAIARVVHRSDRSLRQRAQTKARYAYFEQVSEFIGWAGNHPNIVLAVNTAKERKTINVAELNEIISQGDAVPALRSGVI